MFFFKSLVQSFGKMRAPTIDYWQTFCEKGWNQQLESIEVTIQTIVRQYWTQSDEAFEGRCKDRSIVVVYLSTSSLQEFCPSTVSNYLIVYLRNMVFKNFTTKTCRGRVWLKIIDMGSRALGVCLEAWIIFSRVCLEINVRTTKTRVRINKNLRTFGDLHLFRMTLVHPGMLMSLGRIQCWKFLKLAMWIMDTPNLPQASCDRVRGPFWGDVRLDLLNKFQEEKCHLGLVTSNPEAWKRCRIRRVVLLQ